LPGVTSLVLRAHISSQYVLQLIQHCCIYWQIFNDLPSGFGGLQVVCWPLVPKFAGSHPAEAVGILRAKKSSARLPSEGK